MKNAQQFTVTGLYNSRDYKKVQELDGAIPFVFIPHQREASAAVYSDRDDLISTAYKVTERSSTMGFSTWTPSQLIECFGEDEFTKDEDGDYLNEKLSEAISLAEKNGKVFEVNGEFLESADEFDWACDALGDDLNSSYMFDSLDEAIDWMVSYSRHQSGTANMALAEALEGRGFIERADDDESEE